MHVRKHPSEEKEVQNRTSNCVFFHVCVCVCVCVCVYECVCQAVSRCTYVPMCGSKGCVRVAV